MVDYRGRADVLSREQCLDLLTTVPLGRIVFVSGGVPQAYPVNFLAVAGEIWFRTDEASAVRAVPDGGHVAFEVDSFDAWRHSGWSVLVVGELRPADAAEFPTADPRLLPWAPGRRDQVLRIVPLSISGRRVTPRPPSS